MHHFMMLAMLAALPLAVAAPVTAATVNAPAEPQALLQQPPSFGPRTNAVAGVVTKTYSAIVNPNGTLAAGRPARRPPALGTGVSSSSSRATSRPASTPLPSAIRFPESRRPG